MILGNSPKNFSNILNISRSMRKFVLIALLMLMISGLSCASYYFVILNVSPIKLEPNSETNFTVSVKGLGSQGGYVQLVFRNLSQGLSVPRAGGARYILSLGNRTYNCTMRAGSIEPGNYSFDVGIYAFGAKSAWRDAFVVVQPPAGMSPAAGSQSENKTIAIEPYAAQEQAASEEQIKGADHAQAAPGPGIALAALLLLWLGRRGPGPAILVPSSHHGA
jgi:hypothetical protein